jgi:hypothetical protein
MPGEFDDIEIGILDHSALTGTQKPGQRVTHFQTRDSIEKGWILHDFFLCNGD